MEILILENICFSYETRDVLKKLSLSFETGKLYAITGRSGAGKTTLLSILSGLREPTSGEILCNGKPLKEKNKYEYRSSDIGVVFQNFNLLNKLTAVENVELSMDIANVSITDRREHAYALLEQTGISREEADRRVLKLSGGQQQRVAIARALSYNPKIILADEPTGNLDDATQKEIMKIFRSLANEGKCVILVTHSSYVASCADEIVPLSSI